MQRRVLLILLPLLLVLVVAAPTAHAQKVLLVHGSPRGRLVASFTINVAAKFKPTSPSIYLKGFTKLLRLPGYYNVSVVVVGIGKPVPVKAPKPAVVVGLPCAGAVCPNGRMLWRLITQPWRPPKPSVVVAHTARGSTLVLIHIPFVFEEGGRLVTYPEIRVLVYAQPLQYYNYSLPGIIILTPDSLYTEAERIASLHEEQGFRVAIVTVSDAYYYPPASDMLKFAQLLENLTGIEVKFSDLSLRIISMLRSYHEQGYQYLIILGSAEEVPPSAEVYVPGYSDLVPQAGWILTDFFYAAIYPSAITWPVEGIYYAVGRIPIDDPNYLDNYIQQLYNTYYNGGVEPVVWGIGGPTFGTPGWAGEAALNVLSGVAAEGGLPFYAAAYTLGNETKSTLLWMLENGGLIYVAAHGSGRGFYDYDPIRNAVVNELLNVRDVRGLYGAAKPSIVISSACLNGKWDYWSSGDPYLGEALLGYGVSVAYIGFSRPAIAILNYWVGGAGLLEWNFKLSERMALDAAYALVEGGDAGSAYVMALKDLMNLYQGSADPDAYAMLVAFTLLGDPLVWLSATYQPLSPSYMVAVGGVGGYAPLAITYNGYTSSLLEVPFTPVTTWTTVSGFGEARLGQVSIAYTLDPVLREIYENVVVGYREVAWSDNGTINLEPDSMLGGWLLATYYQSGVGGAIALQYIARGGLIYDNATNIVVLVGGDVLHAGLAPLNAPVQAETLLSIDGFINYRLPPLIGDFAVYIPYMWVFSATAVPINPLLWKAHYINVTVAQLLYQIVSSYYSYPPGSLAIATPTIIEGAGVGAAAVTRLPGVMGLGRIRVGQVNRVGVVLPVRG